MKTKLSIISFVLLLLISGCSNTLTKEEAKQEKLKLMAKCLKGFYDLREPENKEAYKALQQECKEKEEDIKARTIEN